MNRSERGQTLVIFALTMMLLTLMVCMTLSFGVRAKEKMELQVAADAAAYSNAVVTARTYNVISVLNRVQIAEMVAEAGVQSFISWSGAYRGALGTATWEYLFIFIDNYLFHIIPGCFFGDPLCGCSITNMIDIFGPKFNQLIAEETRIDAQWDTLDQAAGLQSLNLQAAASQMYPMQLLQYNVLLRLGALQSQSLAGNLANKAAAGDPWPEWSAPSGADSVTIREGAAALPTGAALETGVFIRPQVIAAMGSRGHPFTTGRLDPDGLTFDPAFLRVMGTPEVQTLNHTGSAYWDTGMVHAASADGVESWADDIPGIMNVNYQAAASCPAPIATTFPLPYWGWVYSTELSDTNDQHQWGLPFIFGVGLNQDVKPPDQAHTLGSCFPLCPGIWPFFMDYNFSKVATSSDAFGQPKNFAVLQRDYGARPAEQADPWNLLFNFRFTPAAGPGQKFDNTGLKLSTGQNISKQVAMATGITYYHRSGSGPTNHWKEPPNFFNPFWRAGLTHADIDNQGAGGDIPATLGAIGQIPYQDAYNNLKAQGFKGIQ